jgi:hypothetical protein
MSVSSLLFQTWIPDFLVLWYVILIVVQFVNAICHFCFYLFFLTYSWLPFLCIVVGYLDCDDYFREKVPFLPFYLCHKRRMRHLRLMVRMEGATIFRGRVWNGKQRVYPWSLCEPWCLVATRCYAGYLKDCGPTSY